MAISVFKGGTGSAKFVKTISSTGGNPTTITIDDDYSLVVVFGVCINPAHTPPTDLGVRTGSGSLLEKNKFWYRDYGGTNYGYYGVFENVSANTVINAVTLGREPTSVIRAVCIK